MATAAEITGIYTKNGRTNVDPEGMAYWQTRPLSELENAFATATPQTMANAAKMDPGYISPEVKSNYGTLFNRTGDQIDTTGGNYWTQQGLIGANLTDAMKASADQIASENPPVPGQATSNYFSDGVGFDSQGRPVSNTVKTPPVTPLGGSVQDNVPATYGYTAAQATPAAATSTGYKYGTAESTPITGVGGYDPSKATASTPDAVGYKSVGTQSQGYTATQQAPVVNADLATTTLNPETDTVEGRIRGLIASNNPLVIQGNAAAAEEMNARGLSNTTMALEAGQKARIASALQIASPDAAAYQAARAQNTAEGNTTNRFNAGNANTVNATNAGLINQASQFTAGAANTASLASAQAENRALELTSTAINSMRDSNALRSTNISQVNAAAENAAKALKASAENEAIFRNAANKISVSLANAGYENAAAAFGAAANNAVSENNAARAQQTSVVNANASNAAAAANADAQNKAGIVAASLLSSETIAKLDSDTKVKLADIQAGYQTLIQASGAASSMSNTTMNELNKITGDPTLSPAMQTAKYNATIDNYNSMMNLIGSINGVDLTGLLTVPKIA
ncbi:MAG: hypothetical protein WC073_11415 [Sterolibacterium sp.]